MESLQVVKIGGNVIDDAKVLQEFLSDFSQLSGYKILVHGGGKKASEVSKRQGITPKMIDGRRITDAATLEVVTMVYGGLVNKKLVAQLQSLGCNAIGLTGADGNMIQAVKRPVKEIDFGFVGDITYESVNVRRTKYLLEGDFTPVFCALTHDDKGQIFNTNADTIAATVASALAGQFKVCLTYVFEKEGVLRDAQDDHSVISELSFAKYENLKQVGIITDGMIPKLDNAFAALKSGVAQVNIGGPKVLQGNQLKTSLVL